VRDSRAVVVHFRIGLNTAAKDEAIDTRMAARESRIIGLRTVTRVRQQTHLIDLAAARRLARPLSLLRERDQKNGPSK